jgi:hypothetical protein
MEKRYNYVYVITNLVNFKQYIGDHSTNNLNDGYFGSGDILIKKVKQYGKENFGKEILEYFDTKEGAYLAQEKYINLLNTHISKGGYNISPKGGYGYSNSNLSESTKKKMSKPKSLEHRKNISKSKQGIPLSNSHKESIARGKTGKPGYWKGKNTPIKGKKLSTGAKQKISQKLKGRVPWNKGLKIK